MTRALALALVLTGNVHVVAAGPWSLTGTAPAYDAAHPGTCPIGCSQPDTATSNVPVTDLAGVLIVRHRQSSTWRDSIATLPPGPERVAAMTRLHDVWTAEAAWQAYSWTAYPANIAGQLFTIWVNDMSTGWSYACQWEDGSGNLGCVSNQVDH